MKPGSQQLGWALQRLAALAGRSLDRLQLHQALLRTELHSACDRQLAGLCQELDWPRALALAALDPARLPVLAYSASQGWLVL
jgi:hypothetical protein